MPDKPVLLFDHVGILVGDLGEGRNHLHSTLGITRWTEEFDDPGIGVRVQFGLADAGPALELIAPLGENSPVAQALRTGQRALNHIAYRTNNIAASAVALSEQGYVATGPVKAAVAYGGSPVQFFISPLKFMMELIEAPEHVHVFANLLEVVA